MQVESPLRRTIARFAVFFALFLAIVGVIVGSKNLFLIAPPYAVTAYLVVFNRDTRYARPASIVASYLVVIASSELFEFAFGVTVAALLLNVTVVSLFITFTPLSHPPALALTIFSYIVHDSAAFVLASLVVLVIVAAADVAIVRIVSLRHALEDEDPRSRERIPDP